MARGDRIERPMPEGPTCRVALQPPIGVAQGVLQGIRRQVGRLGPDAARWRFVDPGDWWIPLWVFPRGTPPDRAADALRRVVLETMAPSFVLGAFEHLPGGRVGLPLGPGEVLGTYLDSLRRGLDRQGFDGDPVETPALVVAWRPDTGDGGAMPWPGGMEEGEALRPFSPSAVGLLVGEPPPDAFQVYRLMDLRREPSPRRSREAFSAPREVPDPERPPDPPPPDAVFVRDSSEDPA